MESGEGQLDLRVRVTGQGDRDRQDRRLRCGLDGQMGRQMTADEDLAGVKALILTTFEVNEYVFEALRSGRQRIPWQGVAAGRAG